MARQERQVTKKLQEVEQEVRTLREHASEASCSWLRLHQDEERVLTGALMALRWVRGDDWGQGDT